MRMDKVLRDITKEAFDNNGNIEQVETAIARALKKIKLGTETYKALISYAAWRLAGDYRRHHRTQVTENIEVLVRERDPRFTPQPRTEEQQQEHLAAMAVAVFDFRLYDNTSIWLATKEKLAEKELRPRRKHIEGCQQRYNFLLSVHGRLLSGQTPLDAGITNDEMRKMYEESVLEEV